MPSESEVKSLVTLDEREVRFKAMLQYLILREACDFESNVTDLVTDAATHATTDAANGVEEKKATYANSSAKKILKEMELKFYDFFVEDDLVEDYLFFGTPGKEDAFNQKDRFKNLIQQKISDKITVINSADTADPSDAADPANNASQHNKKLLKKIVQSPIIENSIMTCDLASESGNSLISDIDEAFKSNNLASIKDNSLAYINIKFLSEPDNECGKIEENSIAIHAHLKTATSLSLGFLKLTGKLIAKTLGDLSGGLFKTDKEDEPQGDGALPSKSVSGEKILKILASLPTQEYV